MRYTSGVYGRANVSTKKKEDAKEAGPRFPPSAPAVLEDNTADWSHAEWEKLFQRCVPNLWIYLYVPFIVSFMIVWLLSNYTRTMFDVDLIVSESLECGEGFMWPNARPTLHHPRDLQQRSPRFHILQMTGTPLLNAHDGKPSSERALSFSRVSVDGESGMWSPRLAGVMSAGSGVSCGMK